jgi:lipoate-protein ligase A
MARAVRVLEPTAPALVLGSAQADPPQPADLAVVRRRSGGGAVLVRPGEVVWVDVDLPVGDERWEDDVGRSFLWLGRAWAGALADLGHRTAVHEGGYEPGRWGKRVCFAGRGPGEVFLDGAKVVGMAQRRTRAGARFQCALLRRWDPEALVDLLVAAEERAAARRDLAAAARGLAVAPGDVVDALVARLG